jgi:hypothetical protein
VIQCKIERKIVLLGDGICTVQIDKTSILFVNGLRNMHRR